MIKKNSTKNPDWLLFFYTVPAKPVGSRTKIWRKLTKIGAVKLKGAVYILPYSDEHHEILQWLISELSSLGGDGALVRTETIEPLKPDEIIDLFNTQCADRYHKLTDSFIDLEWKIDLLRQNVKIGRKKTLSAQLNKLQKKLYAIGKIDFFESNIGAELKTRMKILKNKADQLATASKKNQPKTDNIKIVARKREDYQGKTWITRKKPFVDRMASAWLIRKFIDNQAQFAFIDDTELEKIDAGCVTFDFRNADFTHFEDLCTFETMIVSFALKDRILQRISRIIHDIDLHEDKHRSLEADGVEVILSGIKKTATSDSSALERGMDVFEALYASFT